MRFLSYDSKFSQIMIHACYSACLNLIWLVCCLPIFTIGASTTALYYATLRMARGEESYPFAMFFRSFKENFRQATVLWLILLPVGLLLAGDGFILYRLRASSTGAPAVLWTLLLAVIIAAAVIYVIEMTYVFPLVASVSNTNVAMLKNALMIGVRYLFCTITVFAIHFAMFVVIVRFFTPMIIFGEGLCAWLSSLFLNKVIAAVSYDPNAAEETDASDEDEDQEDTDE